MQVKRFRVTLVGVVVGLALFAAAPIAHAATPQASRSKCEQVTLSEQNLSSLGNRKGKFNAKAFKATATAFHNAGKGIPKKVDKAMDDIGDYYEKIGNAGNSVKALMALGAEDTEKYSKAIIVWSKYTTKVCT